MPLSDCRLEPEIVASGFHRRPYNRRILRTAENLQSGTIVSGSSAKTAIAEQAREIGIAWDRMPERRPGVTLEVLTPTGHEEVFHLGAHATRLTSKEIDLPHKVWLESREKLPNEELHYHDVGHFALNMITRAMNTREADEMLGQLRNHLHEIQGHRPSSQSASIPPELS